MTATVIPLMDVSKVSKKKKKNFGKEYIIPDAIKNFHDSWKEAKISL